MTYITVGCFFIDFLALLALARLAVRSRRPLWALPAVILPVVLALSQALLFSLASRDAFTIHLLFADCLNLFVSIIVFLAAYAAPRLAAKDKLDHISFRHLISTILADSVSVLPDNLAAVITDSLARAATFFEVDYAHIMVLSKDGKQLSCDYEWSGHGVDSYADQLTSVDLTSLKWLGEQLCFDRIVSLRSVSELPEDAEYERALPYLHPNTKSLVWLPIRFGGRVYGHLTLVSYTKTLTWPKETVDWLRVLVNALSSLIEQRRAATALVESESRFRNAFENAPFGIFRNTIDGQVISINKMLAKIIGAPSVEYAIDNFKDIASQFYVYPEQRNQIVQDALNSDGFVTKDILERRFDGSVYLAQTTIRVVRDPLGTPLYVEGYLDDITEKKRNLDALKEAAAFDELLTKILSEFASCTSSQIDSVINNALQTLAAFIEVNHCVIVLIADDRQSCTCKHEYCAVVENSCITSANGISIDTLTSSNFPIGNQCFVIDDMSPQDAAELISENTLLNCTSSLSIPILSSESKLKGILKMGTTARREEWKQSDISHLRIIAEAVANVLQRAKAEEAVAASEHNYRSIFENAPTGIFQSTIDGQLIDINEKLAQIMGYASANEAIESVNDLGAQVYVNANDRTAFIADALEADGFITTELKYYRKDRSIFVGSISMRSVKNKSGDFIFFEGFINDVSEARIAEESLQRRFEIDKVITSIVARFATCDTAELDDAIDSGLASLAIAMSADQAYITTVNVDGSSYAVTNAWSASHIKSMKSDPAIQFELPQGDICCAVALVSSDGCQSLVNMPIHGRAGAIAGTISMASFSKGVVWSDNDITKLRLVGDAVANVIERKRAEEEVRSLNASLEQRIKERTSDLESARREAIEIMFDVDEQRRRAEEALAQLELTTEHLRLLSEAVDNSPAMVMITDDSHLIEYVNPKFTETTGYTAEEVLGQTPMFLQSSNGVAGVNRSLVTALDQGKPWSGEISSRRKNGEVFWEYASFAPIKGPDGEIRHYVAVREDITERKALQDELTIARDEAEKANRTKSLFLANMSHEIRTPMNAILGFSQLLQNSTAFDGLQKKHVDIINRSGEHLLALINDILEMSKIEAGRVGVTCSDVDLLALLTDLSVVFRMRSSNKNIAFSIEQTDDLPRYINTDENKIRQILTNLLGNAVKLTEYGSVILRVSVGVSHKGSYCFNAEVEDTGPGISEKERSKVFKRFEQTESGLRARSGTGLGLAISQQFAHMLHGEITFSSLEGVGTTFRLNVPIGEVDRVYSLAESCKLRVIGLAPTCNVRRVLVVDDEPENCLLLTSMLSEIGFETNEAVDGKSSLELFDRWKPDLVLMDARMPGMDGYEAIRQIRRRKSGNTIPIIAVSASAFEEDRKRMIECGADDFLAKPVRLDSLYSTIASVSGAEYRYLEGNDSHILSQTASSTEMRKHAKSLAFDITAKIRQATIDADFDQVITLVNQIPGLDPGFGDTIREMAEQYDATKIISLLSPDT
jgi:PAS domain S-box-containing protein